MSLFSVTSSLKPGVVGLWSLFLVLLMMQQVQHSLSVDCSSVFLPSNCRFKEGSCTQFTCDADVPGFFNFTANFQLSYCTVVPEVKFDVLVNGEPLSATTLTQGDTTTLSISSFGVTGKLKVYLADVNMEGGSTGDQLQLDLMIEACVSTIFSKDTCFHVIDIDQILFPLYLSDCPPQRRRSASPSATASVPATNAALVLAILCTVGIIGVVVYLVVTTKNSRKRSTGYASAKDDTLSTQLMSSSQVDMSV
eukprot:m.364392 g.364392  ORF g.364392 m.364392 type:complete len:251 (-) comp26888_c0_seq1:234-986(-)